MSKNKITYISTRGEGKSISFLEAMEAGLAGDGGLYLHDQWPDLSSLWNSITGRSVKDVGSTIAQQFIPDISAERIDYLLEEGITFDAPLVPLTEDLFVLELFHGPTFAFKDFGARFMAQMMDYQAQKTGERITILVATSGDTGSAVGRAFEHAQDIDVCLLYPSGKVSKLQEKQLTTIGGNVTALEVDGTFDDCQQLVKRAFSDSTLQQKLNLSSANSINIARLLPQMFYYGRALAELPKGSQHPYFCVPSGNFGNITAGMMAHKTGMPAKQFLAATNRNDSVPQFLEKGTFRAQPSKQTLSSAMDVGNPSNLERIRSIYPEMAGLRDHMWAASFNDQQTRRAITQVYRKHDYILDPHTAVGYLAAQKYMNREQADGPVIILGTAHPAKFADIVSPLIGEELRLPMQLKNCLTAKKHSISLEASFSSFKDHLLSHYAE